MTAAGEITSYTYNPASELLGTDLGGVRTTFGYDAAGHTLRDCLTPQRRCTWITLTCFGLELAEV